MSFLSNFLTGSPGRFEQLPTITPEQKSIFDQILQSIGGAGGPLGSGIQNLQNILSGDPGAFEAFEAPARTAFQQKTIPGIAERFTGAGAQESSGFTQSLGAAGAGLEENLAAQRAQLQSGALTQLQSLLSGALQPQFTTQGIPGQQGALQGILQALGGAFGGAGGAAIGGGLGGLFSGKGFGAGVQKGFGF